MAEIRETPMIIAHDLITVVLGRAPRDPEDAYARRRDLEEVIDYLNVFRSHHPIEDYTYIRLEGK